MERHNLIRIPYLEEGSHKDKIARREFLNSKNFWGSDKLRCNIVDFHFLFPEGGQGARPEGMLGARVSLGQSWIDRLFPF